MRLPQIGLHRWYYSKSRAGNLLLTYGDLLLTAGLRNWEASYLLNNRCRFYQPQARRPP